MKITFLLPYAGLGGGIRVVACLGEHLRRRGHEVFVVSRPLRRPGVRARFRAILRGRFIRRWREHRPEEGFFEKVGFTHHVIDRHRPIVDHDVPDADWVIATWHETANWAAALSPEKGRKAIFLQQYEANIFPDQAAAVDAVWRMPIHKIACSQWLSDLGRERFGTGPIPVVPNGIDAEMFDAPPRKRGRPPTLGFMYSSSLAKGLPIALAVIAHLQEELPHLRIMAYGAERPNPARLPANCEFFFRPVQARLKELYARCDVWLCCSHSEGFHLPPHEAMACRVPVVSTRVGGPMDMIEDGVDGILARPGDVDALAAGVLRLLRCDEAEWANMAELGYRKARSYSWEKSARLFEQALVDAPPDTRTL